MRMFLKNLLIGAVLSGFMTGMNLQSIVFFSFKVNQLELIEKFCVNKNEPELKCDGKCYLADQLKKTETKSPEHAEAPTVNELEIHLFTPNSEKFINHASVIEKSYPSFPILSISKGVPTPHFHPPEALV